MKSQDINLSYLYIYPGRTMNVTIHLVAKIPDNGKPCLYMD